MAKNSTLFSNAFFISHSEKNLKEKTLLNSEVCLSNAVIINILSFSKALTIEKSKNIGFIEVVLN
ncbi:MAG: hypothetical protein AABZ32_05735 [Bacteroidota bacterium]